MQLQLVLEAILGSQSVYFQPPENVRMATFPAIVYQRDYGDTKFADNQPYTHTVRYQVTLISRDPDNPIRAKLAGLPMCLFVRFFTANNLNHDVFTLYY